MRNISELIVNITEGRSRAHAYIVEGRPGRQREEFITKLASGLECTDPDVHARPCGRCEACIQTAAGTGMDIVRMQMSGKTSYRVDDAGEFCGRLGMGAYGRFLIGIIDDADSLSEIVQNKLLKTLEEPESRVVILLASSNRDYLLDTVRSRCSVIRVRDFAGFEDEEDEAASEEISAAAAMMKKGVPFCEFREAAEKCVKTKGDAMRLIDAAEELLRQRLVSGAGVREAALGIEAAENARMDIERGMDKNKALKRLCLELSEL